MVIELRVMKKKEEVRRITKSKFSSFLFSASEWGSGTLGAFLTIVYQRLFICKSFGSICCGFLKVAPIP